MACNKILYGNDDRRHNLYAVTGSNKLRIKSQAASVACFVSQKQLIKNSSSNTYAIDSQVMSLSGWIQYKSKYPLGENEPFGKEKVLGLGTGFLVTEDTLLTVAHNITQEDSDQLDKKRIATTYIVFDYHMEDSDHCREIFEVSQVYTIKKVLDYAYLRGSSGEAYWEDWALVKLDRKVEGRKPLTISHRQVPSSMELYMLGYCNGLPLKFTDRALIMNNAHSTYFECKVDAFGGNSGSPLCRIDNGEVVGILAAGNEDYILDSNYEGRDQTRCVSKRVKVKDTKEFERCQRASKLTFVKDYLACWSSGFKLRTIVHPISIASPGFYILGECMSSTCTTLNQPIWRLRGTRGTFQWEDILHRSFCTACTVGKIKVIDAAFYKSRYIIEGELISPKAATICKADTASKKIKTLDQGSSFLWTYLKIEVTQI